MGYHRHSLSYYVASSPGPAVHSNSRYGHLRGDGSGSVRYGYLRRDGSGSVRYGHLRRDGSGSVRRTMTIVMAEDHSSLRFSKTVRKIVAYISQYGVLRIYSDNWACPS